MNDDIKRLVEALEPFAGDRLPSSKPTEIAFNRRGLRCLMSPLQIARDRAHAALAALSTKATDQPPQDANR